MGVGGEADLGAEGAPGGADPGGGAGDGPSIDPTRIFTAPKPPFSM